MADTDVRRISGVSARHGRNPERHWHCHFVRDSFGAIGKWPVDKPEDNTADFIKPILKIKKSTISVSA